MKIFCSYKRDFYFLEICAKGLHRVCPEFTGAALIMYCSSDLVSHWRKKSYSCCIFIINISQYQAASIEVNQHQSVIIKLLQINLSLSFAYCKRKLAWQTGTRSIKIHSKVRPLLTWIKSVQLTYFMTNILIITLEIFVNNCPK